MTIALASNAHEGTSDFRDRILRLRPTVGIVPRDVGPATHRRRPVANRPVEISGVH